jgi:hypothetical protein
VNRPIRGVAASVALPRLLSSLALTPSPCWLKLITWAPMPGFHTPEFVSIAARKLALVWSGPEMPPVLLPTASST